MNAEPTTTVYEGNTTTVTIDVGTHNIVGVGVARCRPDDVFSKQTGELIALGRALQDLGHQIEAVGDSTVVTVDEFTRTLRLIDEVADETGVPLMPVGSEAAAMSQEAEDKIVNEFLSVFLEGILKTEEANPNPNPGSLFMAPEPTAFSSCGCGQCKPQSL